MNRLDRDQPATNSQYRSLSIVSGLYTRYGCDSHDLTSRITLSASLFLYTL